MDNPCPARGVVPVHRGAGFPHGLPRSAHPSCEPNDCAVASTARRAGYHREDKALANLARQRLADRLGSVDPLSGVVAAVVAVRGAGYLSGRVTKSSPTALRSAPRAFIIAQILQTEGCLDETRSGLRMRSAHSR